MCNLKSVLENETPLILGDFDIQKYQLISARRPHQVIVKKKKKEKKNENLPICEPCRPSRPLSEIEGRQIERSTWTLLENWKTLKQNNGGDTYWNWCAWYSHKKDGKNWK